MEQKQKKQYRQQETGRSSQKIVAICRSFYLVWRLCLWRSLFGHIPLCKEQAYSIERVNLRYCHRVSATDTMALEISATT